MSAPITIPETSVALPVHAQSRFTASSVASGSEVTAHGASPGFYRDWASSAMRGLDGIGLLPVVGSHATTLLAFLAEMARGIAVFLSARISS